MTKIEAISIKGFRSFSEKHGCNLNNIKHFNLLIGQNNSGKSNLIRFFKVIVKLLKSPTSKIWIEHFLLLEVFELSSGEFFEQNLKEKKYKSWMSSSLGNRKIKRELLNTFYKKGNSCSNVFFKELNLEINFHNGEKINIYSCNISNFLNESAHYFCISGKNIEEEALSKKVLNKYINLIKSKFIFIDQLRSPNIKAQNIYSDGYKGVNLAKIILKETNNKATRNSFIQYIDRGFREIIKESLILTPPPGIPIFNPINLDIQYNGLAVKLNDLGSGISQILLLLTLFYRFHSKDQFYIFIDEPELHIHPETLINFFNYVIPQKKYSPQYFLLTHSSTLIDSTDLVNQIYMVSKERNQTNVTEIYDDKQGIRYLLDLLGLKPSQLLQSNCVIWVEGPSDRIYIRHWLEVYSHLNRKKRLIEGKHYSFVMYGGALISYYDVDPNEDRYIDLFSTSNNAYLVADSDLSIKRKQYKKNVNRLLNNSKNNFDLWVTKGKEIENYVPHNIFLDIFTKEKKFKRKSEIPEPKRLKGKTFGESDSYINFFALLYDQRKKKRIVNSHFFTDKVKLAEEVTLKWKEINTLDLDKQIEKLYLFISKSN
ncbi:ATP-dependent nuclease [Priestia megaterium]|uniref:ATP-dependent nuclease n=1 Tax=Priestia megaterium TaxID=1404 RepID=UPI0032E4A6D5